MSDTATDSRPASATVVIAQRVRPEREDEYRRWQVEINARCRTFPGFEGIEVVPPVAGVQDDYVVIFRFDSIAHLDGWLRSDARREGLAQGKALLEGEARQHLVADQHAGGPASGMVVSTRVKPGREREYRRWQDRIDTEAARFPGFLGNEVFPPIPGVQEEWVAVIRFDTAAHLQSWLLSDTRRHLLEAAPRLWDEARVESFSGAFPGWFRAGESRTGLAFPPDWKQAMTVLLALYPTVLLLNRFLSPWMADLPFPVSLFISNVASVALLTWLLMPGVNRLFAFWLTPMGARGPLVEIKGLAIILGAYVVTIAIFVALG